MAKEQPNDLTEQLTDTPKTAVEQAETMQSVPQTIVKKNGYSIEFISNTCCARYWWSWILFLVSNK